MHDDELSSAAANLLLLGRTPLSSELVQAVRDAGSDAVLVRGLFLARDDETQVARWLAEFAAQADAEVVCGEARGSAGRLLIVSARGGRLAPLTAASSVVRGSLSPGFGRAELVVSDAHGGLIRLGVEASRLADGIPLSSELARPAKIQLLAHGNAGPRPVAERVLPAAGKAPTSQPQPTPSPGPPAMPASVDLAGMLDALRREGSVRPLRAHRLLAEVAQAHARAVCASGRVAHELVPGEDPQVRLAHAGVQARLVGETVARAADASTAFAQLVDSPSHRLTLLEPRFTDVGIGTGSDQSGKLCVVVLLAAWPRFVGH